MFDLESIEDSLERPDFPRLEGFSGSELDYIKEVLPTEDPELIAARIDELSGGYPPTAIDSNPVINDLLGPVKDCIDNRYLEAPNDFEQVEMISDSMTTIDGIDYQTWITLSLDDKVSVLQEIEYLAAEIEHRPACVVVHQPISGEFGHYNCRCSPEMNREQIADSLKYQPVITISSTYLDNSYGSYKEALNTIIHEGRHVYQEQNLYERVIHPSPGDLRNWKMNEFTYRYQPCDETYLGTKLYDMQPLETDANKFAEDVLDKFFQKL